MPSNPKHAAKGRKLAPHTKRGIVTARANGATYTAIAKRFGVGITTAWRLASGKGDRKPRPKLTSCKQLDV